MIAGTGGDARVGCTLGPNAVLEEWLRLYSSARRAGVLQGKIMRSWSCSRREEGFFSCICFVSFESSPCFAPDRICLPSIVKITFVAPETGACESRASVRLARFARMTLHTSDEQTDIHTTALRCTPSISLPHRSHLLHAGLSNQQTSPEGGWCRKCTAARRPLSGEQRHPL